MDNVIADYALDSSSTDAEELRERDIGQWGARCIRCKCDRCRKGFRRARRVVHDHLCKWGHWNLAESPHDIPHHTVVPRHMREFYKHMRSKANANEAAIRHRRSMVDDLEGLGEPERDPVDNANQQMEEMISDLHRNAIRHLDCVIQE
jgi:hypothetical protein